MKTFISITLIGFSGILYAQKKLNVTVIGTAHYFSDEYKDQQDFERVQTFMKDQNPDLICIEATPVDDTLSLQEVFPNSMKRASQLRDTLPSINDYDSLVMKGAGYYSQNDFWNAYYQWFLAIEAGEELGEFSAWKHKQDNSEYGLMVFPAAQQMGIQKFYPIDYRYGEKEFLEKNNKVLKKLLFNFKWRPIGTYMKTQKKYKKAEKEGKLMEFINGSEFQGSFSKLIDELPNKLPKSEDASFVKSYWLNRNRIMADRIIRTAETNESQNILLVVGSAHVTHIRRFLEEQGHSVFTYGDFIAEPSQIEN